jgi:hypothetical protein
MNLHGRSEVCCALLMTGKARGGMFMTRLSEKIGKVLFQIRFRDRLVAMLIHLVRDTYMH